MGAFIFILCVDRLLPPCFIMITFIFVLFVQVYSFMSCLIGHEFIFGIVIVTAGFVYLYYML